MRILKDEKIYDGEFIRVVKRHFIDREGTQRVWEMVERKTHGRIVAIAAITPQAELVLEKTFRLPLATAVVELPAGVMDIEGESEEIVKFGDWTNFYPEGHEYLDCSYGCRFRL